MYFTGSALSGEIIRRELEVRVGNEVTDILWPPGQPGHLAGFLLEAPVEIKNLSILDGLAMAAGADVQAICSNECPATVGLTMGAEVTDLHPAGRVVINAAFVECTSPRCLLEPLDEDPDGGGGSGGTRRPSPPDGSPSTPGSPFAAVDLDQLSEILSER